MTLFVLINISLQQYPSEKEIYKFDPNTAVFTEQITNKLVLITQDQGIVHVQITIEGPNLNAWRSIKDSKDCTRGGINYQNIERDFETELTKLLNNAGISRTVRNLEFNSISENPWYNRHTFVAHINPQTPTRSPTQTNIQTIIPEPIETTEPKTIETTEPSTVTLSITPPENTSLYKPTINPGNQPTIKSLPTSISSTSTTTTSTTTSTSKTTTSTTKSTSTTTTITSTSTTSTSTTTILITTLLTPIIPKAITSTKTTTTMAKTNTEITPTTIASREKLELLVSTKSYSRPTSTTTIPFILHPGKTWETYFSHLKQIKLKKDWMNFKQNLTKNYTLNREFLHFITIYTHTSNNNQKQAIKPIQVVRFSENKNNYLELTRFSGEPSFFFEGQRILLNSTLNLQFNFSEKDKNSKQLKRISSTVMLKITCPKQYKVALNTVKKSIKVRSYNSTQSKILNENSGHVTYNFSDFNLIKEIEAYEATLAITLEIKIHNEDHSYNNYEMIIPLGGELLMYISSLNHIKTHFEYNDINRTRRASIHKPTLVNRYRRQFEAAIGTILGIAGDETFNSLKNLFIKSPKTKEASVISLKDHLANFENNNINVLRNINKDIIHIHNITQLENIKINQLICKENIASDQIAALTIKTSLQEALSEISLLVNNISNNRIGKNHPIILKLILICKKINKTQNAAEKPCSEILTRDQQIQIINISYNNNTNTFEIKIAAEMPLFEVIKNANITTYYFLKSLHDTHSEESKITQIDSPAFSKISANNIKPLYYSAVKYDRDAATVRINSHSDEFMNEGVLSCINQKDNSLCPVISTRSDSSCIMQKLTTIANKKFIHFSSTQFIKLTKINSNIHGVMSDETLEGNRFNRIISRYQQNPMQIHCGEKQINLGVDPFQENIEITLQTLTNPLPIRDQIEKLSTQIVEKDKNTKSDLNTLNQELQSLNEDSALRLGGQKVIEPGHWKYITIALTVFVSMFIIYKIIKCIYNRIKTFWFNNFNNPPRQNQRLNGHRLSTRNINRNSHRIETNNV